MNPHTEGRNAVRVGSGRAVRSQWSLAVAVSLSLVVWIMAGLAPGLPKASAADPIRVLEQTHENQFPTGVKFAVKAEADKRITRATVYYKVNEQATTRYASAEITPSTRLTAEHMLDLRKYYSPPGVRIRYQWRLEDESGRSVRSEWSTFTLEDTRFQWRSVTAENVTVSYYQGDAAFGEALRKAAAGAITTLRSQAGVKVDDPIRILIYATDADFKSAVDPSTQEWAGGSAYPRDSAILIFASAANLSYATRTIPHELSHVIVYHATRNPYGSLPRWLDEGLAMLAEGEQEPGFDVALKTAIKEDTLISAWSLSSNFPTDSRLARLSYAQSYSLVQFVISKYGQAAMTKLLAEFREGATYDDALKSALGVDTYGLDDAWRASFGLSPARSSADTATSPTAVARSTAQAGAATPTTASVAAQPTTPPAAQPTAQPATTAAAIQPPVASAPAAVTSAPAATGSPTPTPASGPQCGLAAIAIGALGLLAGAAGRTGLL